MGGNGAAGREGFVHGFVGWCRIQGWGAGVGGERWGGEGGDKGGNELTQRKGKQMDD